MASSCEKCQGAVVPTARTKTFEYEGRTLRCLALVSSCIICGYQWEDDTYEVENARFEEDTRAVAAQRRPISHDSYPTIAPAVRGAAIAVPVAGQRHSLF